MENLTNIYKVGDGCTIKFYTDRIACTVVEVTEKRIVVQEDDATLLNGFDSGQPDALRAYTSGFGAHVEGIQRYAYKSDPEGRRFVGTLRKNGKVVMQHEGMNTGSKFTPGRHKHYDYNF